MKTRFYFLATILIISVLLSACGGPAAPQLEVQDPWVRAAAAMGGGENSMEMQGEAMPTNHGGSEMGMGANSGAFMTIRNNGAEDDRLLAARSDVAQAVEIHLSEMKDGVMTMRQVEGIDVPAKGEAVLKPGSYHVMLIGIKQDLVAGQKVSLTLEFEKSGEITLEAEVRMP